MLIKLLPAYKKVIVETIQRCTTQDELSVCWDLIEVFKLRFHGWIGFKEMTQHLDDINNAYMRKVYTFFTPNENTGL